MRISPLIEVFRNIGMVANHSEAVVAAPSEDGTRIRDRWTIADALRARATQRRVEELKLPNPTFSSREWHGTPRRVDRSRYGNHISPRISRS